MCTSIRIPVCVYTYARVCENRGPRLYPGYTHVVLEQGDTRRWDKPRFDHCAVVLRRYYGGHILMGHYLNTLYPDSRSVSYSSGMWKQGRKEGAAEPSSLPCSLSLSFPFSTASSSSSTLLVTTSFFSVPSDAARPPPASFFPPRCSSVFSAYFLCFWSIVGENASLHVNRYRATSTSVG